MASIPTRRGAFNRAEWEFLLESTPAGTQLTQRYRYLPQTEIVGFPEGYNPFAE